MKEHPDPQSLEFLKTSPETREKMKGMGVRIWSAEWEAYWKPKGAGYTNDTSAAGVWDFEAAWAETCHCGPEKRIEFRIVNLTQPRQPGELPYRLAGSGQYSDTPQGEREYICDADERLIKCTGPCGREFLHKMPTPVSHADWVCFECQVATPPKKRTPAYELMNPALPPRDAKCEICKWSNVSLLNLGDFGKPRWACPGCLKRILETTLPAPSAFPIYKVTINGQEYVSAPTIDDWISMDDKMPPAIDDMIWAANESSGFVHPVYAYMVQDRTKNAWTHWKPMLKPPAPERRMLPDQPAPPSPATFVGPSESEPKCVKCGGPIDHRTHDVNGLCPDCQIF